MTIYKYHLNVGCTTIRLQKDAKILSVINQREFITVYVLVDSMKAPDYDFLFTVYATGEEFLITPSHKFLGTVSLLNGNLIYHVFVLWTPRSSPTTTLTTPARNSLKFAECSRRKIWRIVWTFNRLTPDFGHTLVAYTSTTTCLRRINPPRISTSSRRLDVQLRSSMPKCDKCGEITPEWTQAWKHEELSKNTWFDLQIL